MDNLANLGFIKKTIMETIVSTYNVKGEPNAAPMGVEMKNAQHIIIRPYLSSLTYKNLQFKRCAVINITSDPELYYRTAFKETNPQGRMPTEWFEKAEVVDAPRLREADAFIEVSVISVRSLEAKRAVVLCDIKLVKTLNSFPRAYCRATFATIEAVIHATRVKIFLANGKRKEAEKLIELIEHYHDLVNRVAPNSPHSKTMSDLIQTINSWKDKS
jgi:hypothetical protein